MLWPRVCVKATCTGLESGRRSPSDDDVDLYFIYATSQAAGLAPCIWGSVLFSGVRLTCTTEAGLQSNWQEKLDPVTSLPVHNAHNADTLSWELAHSMPVQSTNHQILESGDACKGTQKVQCPSGLPQLAADTPPSHHDNSRGLDGIQSPEITHLLLQSTRFCAK
ncbi:hypothetical protein B0H13DRAFT_1861579 [Mycena leptocephala]|nr:hypothetical protein B0H13DRAFT_1864413 [Mycena leptocephala]KAJ7927203.1 hypothetical protein B0H13DRAFT_1861579 [Mycena leptocephala]